LNLLNFITIETLMRLPWRSSYPWYKIALASFFFYYRIKEAVKIMTDMNCVRGGAASQNTPPMPWRVQKNMKHSNFNFIRRHS
jgi:hypothetical protein